MLQEKKKRRKKKKPSAMAQVHNRVNAGVMDAVAYGGMAEGAEPENDKYKVGTNEPGPSNYFHVVNESTDGIFFDNTRFTCYDYDAVPFISFIKKDGTRTKMFVGARAEQHSTMPMVLLSNGDIKREDFKGLWDITRDEERSGRMWFSKDYDIISCYSYPKSEKQIYKNCLEAVTAINEKTGEEHSASRVVIDFWTHNHGNGHFIIPLRWFNNGTAEVFLPYMKSCTPSKTFSGEICFKLETTKGRFKLDWDGDDVDEHSPYGFDVYENAGNKTVYITESQMKAIQVLLENEGTNLKKARNFLKANGFDEQQRQELLDSLRHDIPNSRLRECKFMLGVVRLFLTKQLSDGRSIMNLNQVLKYIAMDAHVNEYDNNLNNENLDTLVERFRGAAQTDLQQSMQASNSRNLTVNDNYTIVPIETPEEAEKYGRYVSWCVTQDENAFDSYTSGGLGRFYFCLRKNFKRAKEIPGEGCPLDNYGLSMIAVSVNEDGSLNTVTSRWNHENGGNDNVMSIEQLEDVLGRNFYQTFKPYTREELKAKGLTPLAEIPDLLAAGANPEEIFKKFKPFGSQGVYSCQAGGKWNFVRNVNGKYELCFDKWFGNYDIVFYNDNGFEYAIVYDQATQGANYLLTDLSYLLDKGVTYAGEFVNGYARICVGTGETEQVSNLIDHSGSLIFPKWVNAMRDFSIDEVDVHGMLTVYKYLPDGSGNEYLDWKTNLISVKNPTKFVLNDWYDSLNGIEFYYGEDLVNGYKVYRRKDGPRKELFIDVVLPDGSSLFGKEIECKSIECVDKKFFIIRGNKDLLFSTVFRRFCGEYDQIDCGVNNIRYGEEAKNKYPFLPIRVVKDGKVNYIGENATILSDIWFTHGDRFILNPKHIECQVMVVKVELDDKVNFMDVNGKLISNKWFDRTGNKWKSDDDFGRDSENPRILVCDNGKWYKLFLDGTIKEFEKNGIMSMDDYNTIHDYYVYESKASGRLNEQRETSVDYGKYIKSFIEFLRSQHLSIDPLPKIEFKNDKQEGLFIKTGYYSPDEKKVVVYTDGRHPKDIMRTVAHEFVHHMQNLENPNKDWSSGGDLEEDSKLRAIEGEAFLLGNILFREWTEYAKKHERTLNESITYEVVEPDDVDLSSFNIKKHLNPKFWEDGHLDTRIRLKLLDIADDFFASLGVDWVEPEDVIMTGSLANYNWNEKYSDIDLHVLVDYEDVDERTDFVKEYFTMKKNQWNQKHGKLKIFGFPVEVYVQDVNEPHASSGVYSVDKDKWLTEPDLENLRSGKVDKKHIREMVSTYMNKIDSLIDIYKSHKDDEYEMEKVYEDASDMMDEIKELRRTDLKKYNREMCDGNLIFKALRRSDYIGKLIKLKDLAYDKINSI